MNAQQYKNVTKQKAVTLWEAGSFTTFVDLVGNEVFAGRLNMSERQLIRWKKDPSIIPEQTSRALSMSRCIL